MKQKFNFKKFFGFSKNDMTISENTTSSNCGGECSGGCKPKSDTPMVNLSQRKGSTILDKKVKRREALSFFAKGASVVGAALSTGFSPLSNQKDSDYSHMKMEEYFKSHYRLMSKKERHDTIDRLEKMTKIKHNQNVSIKDTPAIEGVLYGYAFNLSKCQGYGDCIEACVKENNQDRDTKMQYIRIFEMENGKLNLEEGKADYSHMVPAQGHFYLGTQCMQCANPPCTEVCPVQATWQEPDGIVVIDYDWCIGCRYCEAACPYWARRFNWKEPNVPANEINSDQHYLGNRMRQKGVMEKCTFCISRSREGLLPACAEACPTGARVFGNILDPDSEIRYVLENKKVFRLKEDLGTEPKFWYYMD